MIFSLLIGIYCYVLINLKRLFLDLLDDDASGLACVLEIFRVLMESSYRPKRTVQFMAYAAEEAGLLGSKDIARAYHRQGVNVVAMLQMEM
jgi:leucyl aminopeptidase